jgi:hypothetical protein
VGSVAALVVVEAGVQVVAAGGAHAPLVEAQHGAAVVGQCHCERSAHPQSHPRHGGVAIDRSGAVDGQSGRVAAGTDGRVNVPANSAPAAGITVRINDDPSRPAAGIVVSVLHPVRLRIVHALMDRERTTRQLSAEPNDIPRTYAVAESAAELGPRDFEAASFADHQRYFAAFVGALVAGFEQYLWRMARDATGRHSRWSCTPTQPDSAVLRRTPEHRTCSGDRIRPRQA